MRSASSNGTSFRMEGTATADPTVAPLLRDFGDCSELPSVFANGLEGACGGRGILFDVGGLLLAYDGEQFPDGGPESWADFFDVERFPGPRAFPNYGRPWSVLISALLADGVLADALFPLDLDRAFRRLDELKPYITVWWTSGDQSQQMFRTQEVVMGMMFSNRAEVCANEGSQLNTSGWRALGSNCS